MSNTLDVCSEAKILPGVSSRTEKKALLALSQPQGTAVPILNQNLEHLTLLKARGFALLDTEETLNVVQDGSYLFECHRTFSSKQSGCLTGRGS